MVRLSDAPFEAAAAARTASRRVSRQSPAGLGRWAALHDIGNPRLLAAEAERARRGVQADAWQPSVDQPVSFEAPDGQRYAGRVTASDGTTATIEIGAGEYAFVPVAALLPPVADRDAIRAALGTSAVYDLDADAPVASGTDQVVTLRFRAGRRPSGDEIAAYVATRWPGARVVDGADVGPGKMQLVLHGAIGRQPIGVNEIRLALGANPPDARPSAVRLLDLHGYPREARAVEQMSDADWTALVAAVRARFPQQAGAPAPHDPPVHRSDPDAPDDAASGVRADGVRAQRTAAALPVPAVNQLQALAAANPGYRFAFTDAACTRFHVCAADGGPLFVADTPQQGVVLTAALLPGAVLATASFGDDGSVRLEAPAARQIAVPAGLLVRAQTPVPHDDGAGASAGAPAGAPAGVSAEPGVLTGAPEHIGGPGVSMAAAWQAHCRRTAAAEAPDAVTVARQVRASYAAAGEPNPDAADVLRVIAILLTAGPYQDGYARGYQDSELGHPPSYGSRPAPQPVSSGGGAAPQPVPSGGGAAAAWSVGSPQVQALAKALGFMAARDEVARDAVIDFVRRYVANVPGARDVTSETLPSVLPAAVAIAYREDPKRLEQLRQRYAPDTEATGSNVPWLSRLNPFDRRTTRNEQRYTRRVQDVSQALGPDVTLPLQAALRPGAQPPLPDPLPDRPPRGGVPIAVPFVISDMRVEGGYAVFDVSWPKGATAVGASEVAAGDVASFVRQEITHGTDRYGVDFGRMRGRPHIDMDEDGGFAVVRVRMSSEAAPAAPVVVEAA